MKFSAVSGKIDIYGNSGWANAKTAGICTGNGTYSAPYIIEDLIIDGGGSGSCILIENSNVYFRIENCSVYNSGNFWFYAGIRLYNVDNGQLINNNCSSNYYDGILLQNSDNNTVSANFVSKSTYGICLSNSKNNTISGNVLIELGLRIFGNLETLFSNKIDLTNQVNGKPLYYYDNEVNLEPNNFSNAGQVILVNCKDSLISNLNISYSSRGISLHYCSNNTISGNILNNNIVDGIYLRESSNNTISGNTANNNNDRGIYLSSSDDNILSGNTANNNDDYGIYLTSCDSNTISENNVSDHRYSGIFLSSSDDNILSGNTANNNNDNGISLFISVNNTISGNSVNSNTNNGISLSGSFFGSFSNNNTISGNTVNDNIHNGIYLSQCDNNTISGNTVNDNIQNGIYLWDSNNNTISGNGANNNRNAIALYGSSNILITSNILNNNSDYGISLRNSDNNIITFNTITHSSVGIYLLESYSNEISNNLFSDNGVNIKNATEEFFLWIVIIIVISTAIIAIVVTGILIRKRRASKDEVTRYYKLEDKEKQLSNIPKYAYCKTCGKEVRPKYGVPEERPVWKGILLVILFIVTYGIALIIFLLKSFKYCPICGNEVVKFKSKDEVSRYYLKEEENQFRDALELKDDKEVTSSFRKRVQDKVAQYRKLKEKENHLKDGLELNDKKPFAPREKIIRMSGEANEKEEELINSPGWYSPIEKDHLEMSEEYIFKKKFKCGVCRRRFRSRSKTRQCPFCNSENIRKVSSGWWCELVVSLIILVPLMIFVTLFVGI